VQTFIYYSVNFHAPVILIQHWKC